MIKVEKLHKQYGGLNAVNHISFHVAEREKLVLLGTSGCGKTTTLKMINRLIEPTSGTIEINGKNVNHLNPTDLRRQIGYVIQNIGLFPHYTVEENIAVLPHLLQWNKPKIKNAVATIMERLQLPYDLYANKYPAQLSGGQQQRVGLGRALIAEPAVILMDEPFGALDPVTRATVRNEFLQMEEIQKKTAIVVTHDIQEAFEIGDRICFMDQGKIQQIGTAKEFIFHPANDFVRDFIKDQQFYLLLKSLTLNDIIHFLPQAIKKDEGMVIPLTESLYHVLDKMTSRGEDHTGWDTKNRINRQINFSSILGAIAQFKTHQSG